MQPLTIKNVIQLPVPKVKDDKYYRIDIENYQDQKEVSDIDNFDYMRDRGDHSNDYENIYDAEQHDPIGVEDKIVGGAEVDINLYPYHVAYGTNCGGAIIDKKWVMTAGHCG